MEDKELEELFNEFVSKIKIKSINNISSIKSGMGAILRVLSLEEEPISITELANKIDVSKARTTDLIKRMEKYGLILKRRSKKDERVILINLSTQGIEVANSFKKNALEKFKQIAKTIGYTKFKEFLSTLYSISELICQDDMPFKNIEE